MMMMRTIAALAVALLCAGPALAQSKLPANSVWGNPTSGQALPKSMTLPSCAGGSSALIYTLGTGFGCSSSVGPGGAAGGDLSGTYPNPTVAKVNGVTPRTLLTAPATYYANPAGSDANPCTLASQCQTAQRLVDLVRTGVDTGGQAVTLQLTGTFPAGVVCSGVFTGGGTVTLMGDSVTPTNVVLNNGATGVGVLVQNGCSLNISYMRIKAATDIIQTMSTGKAFICGVDFTATGNVHMNAVQGSFMQKNCAVTISGGAVAHEQVTNNSVIRDVGNTTTFTASVAFSTGFLSGSTNGSMQLNGNTYSLGAFTVTGPKYSAVSGSTLNTVGACASLPGSLAGAIGTQGQCL